ncbi:MAG: winged helix DNA-binding domain-containing protein [Gemmatimonadaceae bacterium]
MIDIPRLRLHAQRIAQPVTTTPVAVVTHLGAMQAQDHPGALWSIALRIAGATRADVEVAIAEGTIVRTWPMRGTLHFVPAVDARWMLELMAPRIMKGAAGRHRQLELDDATFRRSRSLIAKALTREPVLTRAALLAVLEAGKVSTVGQRGIHILQRLCMERMLCHGPHSEKQPTFVLFDGWIPTSRQLDREDALRTIAERFFVGHGPATIRDFVWWTGLTVADAKRGLHLAQSSLERIVVDDVELWMSSSLSLPGDDESRAHLLPGFDEYMLGYNNRSAALPTRLASRIAPGANGMFLSTLVLDGQVVGTWRRTARAKSVEIEAVPFARLRAADKRAFAGPLARYAGFLGVPVSLTWSS